MPQIYLIIVIVFSLLYMFAIGGRFIGLILFFLVIILKTRNGFILDGSDNVTQVTLPFLVMADNSKHFSWYNKNKKIHPLLLSLSVVASYALMIQVCFVYFFTSLAKLQGELWLNGTATYYTMRVRDFMATDWNIPLTENHYFVVVSTYFTVLWEMSFPFLIWFRRTKFYIILGGVLLHIGIWIFMRIDNFSWVMIRTYFIFLNNEEYKLISTNFKKYYRITTEKISIFILFLSKKYFKS